MKTRKIGGKFVEKIFGDSKERSLEWPTTEAEFLAMMKKGKYVIDGKEFKIDWERATASCWRGESLQHQSAEPMSEEEKKASKEKRQAGNSIVKQFAGMDRAKQDSILAALKAAGHDISAMEKLLSPAK
jgi:hypothetical protein